MNGNSNEKLLRRIKLGDELSGPAFSQLASLAVQVSVPAAKTIFREGQQHAWIYWIVDGVVTLEMSPSHAGPKAVLTVGSGDLLAWSAFIGNQRMTTSATATTDVQLVGFDSDRLRELCEQDYEIGYRFLDSLAAALSRRLTATRLQLLDLFE